MSQLLVSVRSVEEARIAITSGVDILDVKEPSHGALGAATVETMRAIGQLATEHRPVSVALGELAEWEFERYRSGDLADVQFAKLGLAHCAKLVDWPTRWRAAVESLPATVSRVAVAYADQQLAHSPPWQSVIEEAVPLQCDVLLVDTFDKRRGRLMDWMKIPDLEQIVRAAGEARMKCALAGSLTNDDIAWIRRFINVDVYAVRTAACAGGRNGRVSEAAIRELQSNLAVTESSSSRWNDQLAKSRGANFG